VDLGFGEARRDHLLTAGVVEELGHRVVVGEVRGGFSVGRGAGG
jgi:hypothetical protein